MGKCSVDTLSKTFLIIINTIFIIIGLVIAAFGIIVASGNNILGGYIEPAFKNSGGSSSVASFLTYFGIAASLLGGVILIIAFIGACGACCRSSCLLFVYVAILGVILLVEIAITVVCIVKWDWVTSQLKGTLQKTLYDSYAGAKATDSVSVAWNYVFVTFQCCGIYNSTDLSSAKKWNTTEKVPATCCKVNGTFPEQSDPLDPTCTTKPNTGNSYYHKGCYDKILGIFLQYNDYIIGIAAAIAALQIITLIAAITLARVKNKIHPTK